MTRSLSNLMLGAALALVAVAPSARAQGYKVIVNADNPMTSISRTQLSKFFLRPSAWDDGASVAAVDLEESSDVRQSFSRIVLRHDLNAVKAGWMQQMFAGRGVPPTTRHDDAGVESFVAGNAKAIGYVSAGAEMHAKVKVVRVTDE